MEDLEAFGRGGGSFTLTIGLIRRDTKKRGRSSIRSSPLFCVPSLTNTGVNPLACPLARSHLQPFARPAHRDIDACADRLSLDLRGGSDRVWIADVSESCGGADSIAIDCG